MIQSVLHVAGPHPDVPEIDDRRRAPWLLSPYSATRWTVCDTRDPSKTATIDFDFVLANGESLLQSEKLYATVKEYAWWLRDARFSRIDDATTHALMVANLKSLAHALTIRNIYSFRYLQPYLLQQLVEECRYGTDAVLHASERIDAYLNRLAAANEIAPKPFGGLPRHINATSGKASGYVHAGSIAAACSLPPGVVKLKRVTVLIGRAASLNGFKTNSEVSTEELPALNNITVQAVQRWFDPLEQLYAMRRKIEAEAITFKPFPFGAAKTAAVKGVGTERTPIPPPNLALYLLEHSARWIFDHDPSDDLVTADRTQVRLLATACWIVIAAFTARRAEEINDLREGCLRGDDASGWWINVYIEKTLQRKEDIPVPGLVARAIATLSALSSSARADTCTDQLFQWKLSTGKIVRPELGRCVNEFAAAVSLPMHQPRGEEPVAWHWHPHQFRRFCAVLYFYRYEGATLEALSHHLRHFSIEMTRRYVTQDPEVAALWTDVEWGYTGHVARAIAAGERSVSGPAGERLKKATQRILDALRRTVRVALPDQVGSMVTMLMQRQGIVLTPKPWGVTCTCPKTRDATTRAACRRGSVDDPRATGPDFARAGPTVCPGCPYGMLEGNRTQVVDAEASHLEAAAAGGMRAGTLFGALEANRLVEIRHFRDTHYGRASPLDRPEVEFGDES